jgi:hypothetical protein
LFWDFPYPSQPISVMRSIVPVSFLPWADIRGRIPGRASRRHAEVHQLFVGHVDEDRRQGEPAVGPVDPLLRSRTIPRLSRSVGLPARFKRNGSRFPSADAAVVAVPPALTISDIALRRRHVRSRRIYFTGRRALFERPPDPSAGERPLSPAFQSDNAAGFCPR